VANKGPALRPPDYKREPFATHSGKKWWWLGDGVIFFRMVYDVIYAWLSVWLSRLP
jgi:hypothetical protein